jgi:site-specific recombinase XerD
MGHREVKYPKFTHGYVDQHGKPRFYLRRPGHAKIPLPGLPWSPEFMTAREIALQGDAGKVEIGAKRTVPGTVNAAVIAYVQSTAFTKGLAKSSQNGRRAILERFREGHGDKRVALMHSGALQIILNGKTPSAQRNWRKALRGFLDHCQSLKMIRTDPLAGVKLVKMRTTGHHPWESGECAKFENHHPLGTRARLAYELLLQAGQSKCDVVRLGRQHVRAGSMSMRRQKTGVAFYVEVMPALQAAIDAMPASDHLTFLVTAQGKPFTAAGFGNHFRDLCAAAGLPSRCTSHGLRKAAATYLAEQGATDHQLMAWFGWTSISQAQVYTKAANRKLMAKGAAKLVSGTGIGSLSDPMSQNSDQPIENSGAGQ